MTSLHGSYKYIQTHTEHTAVAAAANSTNHHPPYMSNKKIQKILANEQSFHINLMG